MKAVKFEKFGGVEVLNIEEVPYPVASENQVVVKVKAAGINPGEVSIRKGLLESMFKTNFPSGQGTDFAGTIEEVGPGVTKFKTGDEVIGYTDKRASHAEFLAAEIDNLVYKPENVSWEQAGALFVVGSTAQACINAVAVTVGDTVVVSGAAGGVGSLVVQLAKNLGATVIGLAGEDNQQWLTNHGVIGVVYGDGQIDRIKAVANGKIDAFIDTFGKGYVDLAIELGVAKERINTIIDFEAAGKYHIKAEGSAKASSATVLADLSTTISAGKLDLEVAKTFPLDEIREAYTLLEERHTRGKIVLIP